MFMQTLAKALQSRSTLFSGFLHSAAFLLQAVRSQTICFHRSRRVPYPNLLYTGAMRSGQLFNVRVVVSLPLYLLSRRRFVYCPVFLLTQWLWLGRSSLDGYFVHRQCYPAFVEMGSSECESAEDCIDAALRLRKVQPSSLRNCSTSLT